MADQPTVARLRAVLAELSGFVHSKGTGKQKRMLFVVNRMANDICEELQDSDQATLSEYFSQMGQVISWIGTGSYDGMTEVMREWIRPRAEAIQELTGSGVAPSSSSVDGIEPGSELGGEERPHAHLAEAGSSQFFGDFVEEELVATQSGVNNGNASADTWTR